MPESQPLSVVVLSCGNLGLELANALEELGGVRSVTLVTTPYRTPRRTFWGKIKHLYRMEGLPGFVKLARAKLGGLMSRPTGDDDAFSGLTDRIRHLRFANFHTPECLEAIRELEPDLGIVAGTYILKESVFGIPRQGCLNLHSGKVPEYRGAAPAFWELYNGESEVGITIHQVSAKVDEGAVLLEETFPLDSSPRGDPLAYVLSYRRDVLQPNGIRMMVEAVRQIADGSAVLKPQDPGTGRTYRSPTYANIKELRRRVRERRS